MTRETRHRTSSWRAVLALFFITSTVESMSMSHVFAFLPVYLQSMQVPHVSAWVGILSAITFVVGLPLVPLWGIWAQRYGGKLVVMRSAYVEMVVFLLLGFSHNLAMVLVAMVLVGFQLGNTGIMLSAIRHAAPDGRVGFAVSLFSVSSSVGMAGGPLIGGLITGLHLLNLHGLYIVDGALSCITGTLLLFFYHEADAATDAGTRTATGPQTQRESSWSAAWKSVRFTFTLRVTWVLFAVYTVLMMARQMMTPYLPIVIEHLSLPAVSTTVAIGGLMGLSAVVGAIITVIAGRLGDRVGFVRILLLAFAGSVPAAALLAFLHGVFAFAVALTVVSAGYSLGGAMVFALFSTRIPATHRTTALNLVYLPLYLGGIVGPAFASLLTRVGLYGPFLGAAVVLTVGFVVTVGVLRRTQATTADAPSLTTSG